MIKGIVITILVMIGLIDYALVVACSRLEDKESYEAYERADREEWGRVAATHTEDCRNQKYYGYQIIYFKFVLLV